MTNTATVSSTTPDPVPANNTDAAALNVAQESDLSIVKRAPDPRVRVFQDITYALTVANAGPNDATGVVVSDPVPIGFVFVSADPSCTFDAGTVSVICTVGDLPNAASRRSHDHAAIAGAERRSDGAQYRDGDRRSAGSEPARQHERR